MLDMKQSKRPIDATYDAILRERDEHGDVIDAFHRVFFDSRQTISMTFYEGIPLLKSPLDLWVYQEIIWDLRPTLIIETGTAFGASALYFARQLDRCGEGHVISIDVEPNHVLPQHPRIDFVRGDCLSDDVLSAIDEVASTHPRVMVALDSDHARDHVLAELNAYARFVTPGQFLVVEDTNLNGRPVNVDWKGGLGPGHAVDAWLPQHRDFTRALMAERYMVTTNTWLRRRS